jgi:hypothetical protein
MTNSVFCVHRMVGNDFNPASVILCHNSIVPWLMSGVVAFKIRVLRVPKTTPRKFLASDGYPSYVENHPLVFGTVTAGSTCWRGARTLSIPCVEFLEYKKETEKNDSENDRILRKATAKSGRSVGVCEIELIWAIKNLVK